MSHWTSIKNKNLSNAKEEILLKALSNLGLGINKKIKKIDNAYGEERVDFALYKLDYPSDILSLGFKTKKNQDGTLQLELVGDFFLTGLNGNTFMDSLSVEYSKENVKDRCEEFRYYIENETENEKGETVITAYKYV